MDCTPRLTESLCPAGANTIFCGQQVVGLLPRFPGTVTPPGGTDAGSFAIYWGLDDKLKTPYSHVVDFSITRELSRNFVLEATYIGRFAHQLLQEEDLASLWTSSIQRQDGLLHGSHHADEGHKCGQPMSAKLAQFLSGRICSHKRQGSQASALVAEVDAHRTAAASPPHHSPRLRLCMTCIPVSRATRPRPVLCDLPQAFNIE